MNKHAMPGDDQSFRLYGYQGGIPTGCGPFIAVTEMGPGYYRFLSGTPTQRDQAKSVGRHRCWVGDSGDFTRGVCHGKPHMTLRPDGGAYLGRYDGTFVRLSSVST